MIKKSWIPVAILCMFSGPLAGQEVPTAVADNGLTRVADFDARNESGGWRYHAVLPALQQRAGAPPAFWEYFWIFGDGAYSRAEAPFHLYRSQGTYETILLATGNYDTGKPPVKKKKKVSAYASTQPGPASPSDQPFADAVDLIGLDIARDPSPGEENVIVLGYRNNRNRPLSGKLHLFFNERRFPQPHFGFQESHLYFGEQERPQALGATVPPQDGNSSGPLYANLGAPPQIGDLPPLGLSEMEAGQSLEEMEKAYYDHWECIFSGLQPGEQRNLFVSLLGTPEMVKDTAVIITLTAVIESDGDQVFEMVDLEIPIVSAHDPNVQQVSDHRAGFRRIREKKFRYRTRFQNTGEGPAEIVKIETEFRPEKTLDIEKLEILEMYPEVPLCPTGETVGGSCLDTSIVDGRLIFTFRNIYLPGTRQEGVEKKDSTKGFIRYAVVPAKKMERRSFRSRAAIFFDNEPPVRTNWANTRFRWLEPSLMPVVGYKLFPDSTELGYFFAGVGVASAYKAYGFYWQPELRTGVSGKKEASFVLPEERYSGRDTMGDLLLVTDTIVRSAGRRTVSRNSFELVPLHFRRNLTFIGLPFIGVGVGAAYLLTFEHREETVERNFHITQQQCFLAADGTYRCPGDPRPVEPPPAETREEKLRSTSGEVSLFFDVNVGLVKAGPVVGARTHYRLGQNPGFAMELYGAWRF